MIRLILAIALWLPTILTGAPESASTLQTEPAVSGVYDLSRCTYGQSTHVAWRIWHAGSVQATIFLAHADGTESTYKQVLTVSHSGFPASYFFPDSQTRVVKIEWTSDGDAEPQMAQCNLADWPPEWIRENYQIPTSLTDCHSTRLNPHYSYMHSYGCPVLE